MPVPGAGIVVAPLRRHGPNHARSRHRNEAAKRKGPREADLLTAA